MVAMVLSSSQSTTASRALRDAYASRAAVAPCDSGRSDQSTCSPGHNSRWTRGFVSAVRGTLAPECAA